MNKHPIDWLIHFGLCFLGVLLVLLWQWTIYIIVAFVIILVEYEQWVNLRKPIDFWISQDTVGDIIFGLLGIITAGLICSL